MTATTDIIIALLKQTPTGSVSVNDVAHEANVAVPVANFWNWTRNHHFLIAAPFLTTQYTNSPE